MKVGIIGLGRMGEGMSRRMMSHGIDVWGYRRNYDKAQEAYEKGYVSGVAIDIPTLCATVKQSGSWHLYDGSTSRKRRGHYQ